MVRFRDTYSETSRTHETARIKTRFFRLAPLFVIMSVIAQVLLVLRSEARVVSEEFIENGKKIVVLQNIREDGLVEGMAISGPNGIEIRVDTDGDGGVDWRKIESGEYEIEQSWPTSDGLFHRMKVVKKLEKERVEALFFLASDRKGYDLWKIEKRPYEVMFAPPGMANLKRRDAQTNTQSINEPLPDGQARRNLTNAVVRASDENKKDLFCDLRSIENPSHSSWRTLASRIEAQALMDSQSARALIHPSCGAHMDVVLRGMARLLSLEGSGKKSTYFKCMAEMEGYKAQGNDLLLKFWAKIYASHGKPVFQCTDDIPGGKRAKFEEQSSRKDLSSPPISISSSFLKENRTADDVAEAWFHEMFHSAGYRDEAEAQRVERCCSPTLAAGQNDCFNGEAQRSNGDPRILSVNGLAKIAAAGEKNGNGDGNSKAIAEMAYLLKNNVKSMDCIEDVGGVGDVCRSKIRSELERFYLEASDKVCIKHHSKESCREIKDELLSDLSRQVERCLRKDPNNLCESADHGGKSVVVVAMANSQTKSADVRSKQPAQKLQQGPSSVPQMRYQAIQADNVGMMRAAAVESNQRVVPKTVAMVRNAIEKVTREELIPRAEAQAERNRRTSGSKMSLPRYSSFNSEGRPLVRLSDGSSVALYQPFETSAGKSLSARNMRSVASTQDSFSIRDSENLTTQENLGGADAAGGGGSMTRRSGQSGSGRSGGRSQSDDFGEEERSAARTSLPAIANVRNSVSARGNQIQIKTAADAMRILRTSTDPEKFIVENEWFEKRLSEDDLKVQIVGGRRKYGSLEDNPKARWNIKMFLERESP